MKNLSEVSVEEQKDFINSFDYVFCDVDGVLWTFTGPIEGPQQALKSLEASEKKIVFISNNCTKSQDEFYNQLKKANFELENSALIRPTQVVISYLKKINFSKSLYTIASGSFNKELEAAGFVIKKFDLENPEESVEKFVKNCITVDDSVGAVLLNLDVNLTAAKLQKAATYLKNPDVLFLTGPGAYYGIIADITGRTGICLAKPSQELNVYIKEKYHIQDPKRILFIGDSVDEDMAFATKCGYQKLLVLSGITSKAEVESWKFPEEYKPQYYAKSLDIFNEIFKKINVS